MEKYPGIFNGLLPHFQLASLEREHYWSRGVKFWDYSPTSQHHRLLLPRAHHVAAGEIQGRQLVTCPLPARGCPAFILETLNAIRHS